MDKKKPPKTVLGRDIFVLFLTYSLKILPVVEKKKIIAFLDKSKTFSMQNIDSFLDQPLKKESLLKLCTPETEENFFTQLQEKHQPSLPLVVVKDSKITIFPIAPTEFFFHFNPLKKLQKEHCEMLFYALPIAFIVYNCFLTPLCVNETAKTLLRKNDFLGEKAAKKSHLSSSSTRTSRNESLFGEVLGETLEESDEWMRLAYKVGEMFLTPLQDFQKKRTKKIYQHTANKKNITITAEKIVVGEKMVWVLYFVEQNA